MAGSSKDQTPKYKSHLPLSRVKVIMKSSPDVESVGHEPLFLVAKLTHLFITDLGKKAYENCENKTLEYKHIAEVVNTDESLDFLREIMPRKITVRQFKDYMLQKAARGEDYDSDEPDVPDEPKTRKPPNKGKSKPKKAKRGRKKRSKRGSRK